MKIYAAKNITPKNTPCNLITFLNELFNFSLSKKKNTLNGFDENCNNILQIINI